MIVIEGLMAAGILWSIHASVAALPVICLRTAKRDALQWRQWEWLYFVLPFWTLIGSQVVFPTGGFSNWIIELGTLTIAVFLCVLLRIVLSPIGKKTSVAVALLGVSCMAAIGIHIAVPPLPD